MHPRPPSLFCRDGIARETIIGGLFGMQCSAKDGENCGAGGRLVFGEFHMFRAAQQG